MILKTSGILWDKYYCDRCGEKISHKQINCRRCNRGFKWKEDESNIKDVDYNHIDKLERDYLRRTKRTAWEWIIGKEKKDVFRRRLMLDEIAEAMRRTGNRCGDCNTTTNLSVHHIIPLSKGGTNEMGNLTVLCRGCNSKKGNKL